MYNLRLAIKSATLAMAITIFLTARALAQEYSCGAYGAGDFGEGACTGAASGDIANTGLNVWLIRVLALLLIALAVFVVGRTIKRRKNK